MTRFVIQPHLSQLTVLARSTTHPITRSGPVTGHLEVSVLAGGLDVHAPSGGLVELDMHALRGDDHLDREVERRLDMTRYPRATALLREVHPTENGGYLMRGDIALHGATRSVEGIAVVSVDSGRSLSLQGSLRLDIREFGIEPPRLLMLKVHPEVDVVLELVALADGPVSSPEPG